MNASGNDIWERERQCRATAGLKLVITTQALAEPPQTAVKVLLDRVPPALGGQTAVAMDQLLPLAGDQGGPFALQPIHHILISNGGADPRDHAVQRGEAADFSSELIDPAVASDYALQDILWPTAVADKCWRLRRAGHRRRPLTGLASAR